MNGIRYYEQCIKFWESVLKMISKLNNDLVYLVYITR